MGRPTPTRAIDRLARLAATIGAAAGVAACDDLPRGYDPFPIAVDVSGGAVLARADSGGAPFPIALDILSPLTTLDVGAIDDVPRRRLVDRLMLHGVVDGGSTPRALFEEVPVLTLSSCPSPPCTIGADGAGRVFAGIIGTDLLSTRAVRFDFPAAAVRFFPDIAGTANEHSGQCEAVMDAPFSGGGTMLVDGAEFNYLGRRTVVGACLGATPGPIVDDEGTPMRASGTDAVVALSTAVGSTVLSASAWDRLALATGGVAAADLPRVTLLLPGGPAEAGSGTVARLAITGDLGADSERRGPCRELLINRMMAQDVCDRLDLDDDACPCVGDDQRCPAAAAVELSAALPVAVLDDTHPFLQGLRDELRPVLPEIDGVLGADALAPLRVDLDYPNDRVIMKCIEGDACTVRPRLTEPGKRLLRESAATCAGEAVAPAGEGGDAGPSDGGPTVDGGAPTDAGVEEPDAAAFR